MIRINRLGILFGLAAVGYVAPASAQVVYRDRWVEQQEAKILAEIQRDRLRENQSRIRIQQERSQERIREQQSRMREQMREQQERMREQQAELRERQLERELERAVEMRERMFERSREQRELTQERAREIQERAREIQERAEEARERALERLREQQINEFPTGRRVYIRPPANIRIIPR